MRLFVPFFSRVRHPKLLAAFPVHRGVLAQAPCSIAMQNDVMISCFPLTLMNLMVLLQRP
jgi:hypothetical protein